MNENTKEKLKKCSDKYLKDLLHSILPINNEDGAMRRLIKEEIERRQSEQHLATDEENDH